MPTLLLLYSFVVVVVPHCCWTPSSLLCTVVQVVPCHGCHVVVCCCALSLSMVDVGDMELLSLCFHHVVCCVFFCPVVVVVVERTCNKKELFTCSY